jgi:valyl-tRNA synthetase
MHGDAVVWIPGTDHAGIATQVVVERYLARQGLGSRHDLGRDKFVEEVWRWREKKGDAICDQLRHLGVSLDWNRQFFTLDQVFKNINQTFIRRAYLFFNIILVIKGILYLMFILFKFKQLNGLHLAVFYNATL